MNNEFIMPAPPLPRTPAEEEKLRGRLTGFKEAMTKDICGDVWLFWTDARRSRSR